MEPSADVQTAQARTGGTTSKATTTPLVCSAFEHLFPDHLSGASADTKSDGTSKSKIQTQALKWPPRMVDQSNLVSWTSAKIRTIQGRQYYSSCSIKVGKNKFDVEPGDFVRFEVSEKHGDALDFLIVKINDMFEVKGVKKLHGIRFMQGAETILGEALNPKELFVSRDCDDLDIEDVVEKVEASFLNLFFLRLLLNRHYINRYKSFFKF